MTPRIATPPKHQHNIDVVEKFRKAAKAKAEKLRQKTEELHAAKELKKAASGGREGEKAASGGSIQIFNCW